jgi:K+-transporting ATPase ATPase A chain
MITALLVVAVFLSVVFLLAWPLGKYIYYVVEDPESLKPLRSFLSLEKKLFSRVGNLYFQNMTWREYFFSLLAFHTLGIVLLFLLLRFQGLLSFFDRTAHNMPAFTAFNTAISFVTNTDWQSSIPEKDVSWIIGAVGLGPQLFFSAAVGICLLCCLSRAFVYKETKTIGSFWKDLVRISICVLFPLALLFSPLLVATGVPQSFKGITTYSSYENPSNTSDILLGCTATHVAIRQLGTNGGGLYAANAAHPFENPSPWSNILEIGLMLLIPIALCRTFGEIVRMRRQAILLLSVMGVLFLFACAAAFWAEGADIPFLAPTQLFHATGNMEGKECRFGPFWSIFWSVSTTATSTGSVNSSLSSYLPLGGGVPLALMQLGEVIFGGVGTGAAGAIVFLLVAVFAAGLMVGRTPEYLGKKIETREMKFVTLLTILPAALVLITTAIVLTTPIGISSLSAHSSHGVTEALYAFSSAAANNGSSFAGLDANIPFYNVLLGIVMYISRLFSAAMILALAGSLAGKKQVAIGAGTLPTDTVAFGLWFAFVILIIGALNFLPAFVLGPGIEHMTLCEMWNNAFG